MKVVARIDNEELTLKNYKSYLEMDEDLSLFHSLEEIKARLDLSDEDQLFLDIDDKSIPFNSELIRTTLSLYKNKKGDEFINWIIASARDIPENSDRLFFYFTDRYKEFTSHDIKNSEGNRLKNVISRIRSNFVTYRKAMEEKTYLECCEADIKLSLKEYLKQNGEYNYGYMRKFISTLASSMDFKTKEIEVEPIEITEEKQDKVIYDYETVIHNHFYPEKQVTFDDLMGNQTESLKKNLTI